MKNTRPYALSIAGFDPSAGAGILADIKTLEQNHVYGLGVTTALTYQNDLEFDSVEWIPPHKISKQIEVLTKRFAIKYAKIGLIEDFNTLELVVDYLTEMIPKIFIVWDPVLKASTDFKFHDKPDKNQLNSVLSKIGLLTPNAEEAAILFDENYSADFHEFNYLEYARECDILITGIKEYKERICDYLFTGEDIIAYRGDYLPNTSKHGSGCVLSSAILASLAKGSNIQYACEEGRKYVLNYLVSTDNLLGNHSLE